MKPEALLPQFGTELSPLPQPRLTSSVQEDEHVVGIQDALCSEPATKQGCSAACTLGSLPPASFPPGMARVHYPGITALRLRLHLQRSSGPAAGAFLCHVSVDAPARVRNPSLHLIHLPEKRQLG